MGYPRGEGKVRYRHGCEIEDLHTQDGGQGKALHIASGGKRRIQRHMDDFQADMWSDGVEVEQMM